MRDDSGTRVADRVRDRNDGTRIRTDNGGTGDEGEITIATPANDTSRMTVPALEREGEQGDTLYPSPGETAGMSVPALLDGGATRAARVRDQGDIPLRDGADHDTRVGERRRNEGDTRAR